MAAEKPGGAQMKGWDIRKRRGDTSQLSPGPATVTDTPLHQGLPTKVVAPLHAPSLPGTAAEGGVEQGHVALLEEAKTQGLGASTRQLLKPQQAAGRPTQWGGRMLLAQGRLRVSRVGLRSPSGKPRKQSCRLSPGKVRATQAECEQEGQLSHRS